MVRNTTKVFNYEANARFCREESDPSLRQSIFNESNQFYPADHMFGMQTSIPQYMIPSLKSNPMNMEGDMNPLKIPSQGPQQMLPLQHDNLQLNPLNGKVPSIPKLDRSNNTASFGQISLRSGRTISQVGMMRSKSNASKLLKRRDISSSIP